MSISRRTFVGSVVAGSATVAAGLSCSGCGNPVSAAPYLNAAVDDDPASPNYGKIAIPIARFPDLQAIGGAVTVLIDALAPGKRPFAVPEGGVLLIHRGRPGDPAEYAAVQSLCPHAQCPLGYSAVDDLVECPCHPSRFRAAADPTDPSTRAGQVTHLPARADLAAWETKVVGQIVYIDLAARTTGTAFPDVAGGKVVIAVSAFPSLATPGGSITGQPKGLGDVLIVARVDMSTVIALSAVCTHAACNVNYSPSGGDFVCPCHGSTFTAAGAVVKGAAPSPLKKYAVSFDGQTITISV